MAKTETRNENEERTEIYSVDLFKKRINSIFDKDENPNGPRQKDICQEIGMAESTLSNYKNPANANMPELYQLCKLALALNLSLDYMVGLSEQPNKDTTLAATGLTSEALEQLISIEKTKPLYKGMTSQIIKSDYFSKLVENFFYLKNHAEYVSTLTKFVNDGILFFSPPDPPEVMKDFRHTLYEFADQLKYERYAVAETALKMLDDVVNIEKVLKEAETALAGYEPFDEYEMKGDDDGEATK